MATLVLGAAGAIAGSFFGPLGASIGWALGSALGSALDPPKSQGPRLTDLKLQGSNYGAPIPIIYAMVRLSGQLIWTTDLVEHKHVTGGKGGPQVTTFTYSASFAVGFCEGPVESVRKVWADSVLVYDASSSVNTGAWPMTIYLGTETQLPDPTMEAELNTDSPTIGQVPAHRGMCYIVMTDLELGDYGNRIPSLTAEISSSITRAPLSVIAQETGDFAYPANYGADYLTFENGELTAHWPDSSFLETRFNGPTDIASITGTEWIYDPVTALPIGSRPFSYPGGFNYFDNWANWFVGYLGEYPVWWQVDGHAGLNTDYLVIGSGVYAGSFPHGGGVNVERIRGYALTQDKQYLWVFINEADAITVRYDVWDTSRTLIRTVYYSGVDPLGASIRKSVV